MSKRVKIPIRVHKGQDIDPVLTDRRDVPPVADAMPPVMDGDERALRNSRVEQQETREQEIPQGDGTSLQETPEDEVALKEARAEDDELDELLDELKEWQDRALRLQAEMENFRKRQQRLADERVMSNKEHLLRGFLDVKDDLERALSAERISLESLKQGVKLTHQAMNSLLQRENVQHIDPAGEAFDPLWHEAVATVPHEQVGVEPDTVVEVVRSGYVMDDRLLRPARVVVAV